MEHELNIEFDNDVVAPDPATQAMLDRFFARITEHLPPGYDKEWEDWVEGDYVAWKQETGDQAALEAECSNAAALIPNLNRRHADYLRTLGFKDAYLMAGGFRSISSDAFAITGLDHVGIRPAEDGYKADPDQWSGVFVPAVEIPRNSSSIVIVNDPVTAMLAMATGVMAVAVPPRDWVGNGSTMTPLDVGDLRIPEALKDALTDKDVLVSKAFGQGDSCLLGHAIKYHVPVKSLHIFDDSAGIAERMSAKVELPRFYKSFAYDIGAETGEVLNYHYPLAYPANDLILPKIAKDAEVSCKESAKDSSAYVARTPIDGLPLARIRRTLRDLEFQGDIALMKGNGAGQAGEIEDMVGVTSSRNTTDWCQSADESAEKMIRKGFTSYDPRRAQEFRNLMAAQKTSRDHRIEYVTSKKGWIGVQKSNGEEVFPAAYILEGRVVQVAGVSTIIAHPQSVRKTSTTGSIVDWCTIISPALHNANLSALIGFSISGLFLPFLNGDGEAGIIHLIEGSGHGKTSLQQMIASTYTAPLKPGKANSGILSWRTTENGLEAPFVARNHAVALIDEIGAAGSNTDWPALIYMLANGVAKSRMNADGTARETRTWQTQTISTGEASFGSQLSARKLADRGGLYFRLMDVLVANAGFWGDIQTESKKTEGGRYRDICQQYGSGSHSPSDIIDAIMTGLSRHHGHVWMMIAQRLLKKDVRDSIRKTYLQVLKDLTSQCKLTQGVEHRRSKHLAAAITGLELLLETMGQVIAIDGVEDIRSKARSWLIQHLWKAGLPENFTDESSRIAERALEFIAMRPHRFVRRGEGRTFSNEYWGWLTLHPEQLFVTSSGINAIAAELNEDPQRLQTALKKLTDDAWISDQQRPIGGGNGMRGLLAPTSFKLISTGA